ncbi:methionyl-tRNA formyltransferase [Clostridium pasteurianum DSM 525 = ATCC 6013]|uniref:Methionyl-tRNA formyltransferase n=1 Tax=Clostridium pasteurianum DSM 525 = ATCC 6013 TaxID=1262449 RepID=A0A0H3J3Y6_CLOPA|nr:methionyl-tRNA formyltransferase [Clostridium pasteurianum]AJA48174.1 methionyl-tRNA formyltransferase [Clostridium pasteurianum DSM 525 = ATCC 6013]AJA52162.1 methionyl-tRNA formyltransferase [Clostridium pasteurianum DSM 525 = ATCC 6013]AOZ77345.1 methionyl-tRNA formyltransferase [Clostridium pasteurianum DSM 525 = ATCC 6013]AOZ81142.1 methionyl-tRNA formyltransferase [Clostridium pasteurianum]ELP60674.1 methionyl-tRNA formyltransferase [Clostridium pasteurianum DSM 525 = ATCC 6013]
MNIVFMGTPEFSVPSLEKLIEKFNVKAVFTQPDKPKGRGKKVSISAVKEIALKNNIPVYQPEKIKKETEIIEKLKEINPDFIIVVAFGQILSKEILDIPKYACINLHASLLPKLRGAAPINWAIINGETVSGNTTMLMDVGLDTGDMLLKDIVDITGDMTAGDLHDILMERGADLLVKTINEYVKGTIVPEKQKDENSNYAPMLTKQSGEINWNTSGKDIYNLVRGLNPYPLAHCKYNEKNMKIHKVKVLDKVYDEIPGTIIEVNNDGIIVACKNSSLLIEVIQFPGKRSMTVEEYTRGNKIDRGVILQ